MKAPVTARVMKRIAEEKGWTAVEFGNQLDITKQYISLMQKGRMHLSMRLTREMYKKGLITPDEVADLVCEIIACRKHYERTETAERAKIGAEKIGALLHIFGECGLDVDKGVDIAKAVLVVVEGSKEYHNSKIMLDKRDNV